MDDNEITFNNKRAQEVRTVLQRTLMSLLKTMTDI